VRYEMFLRNLETQANTVVGLSGSFFGARREVCQDWAIDCQSDFNTLLNAVKMGLRGVSDRGSVGYRNIIDETREFERKVRTVLRGISVLLRNLAMLNPLRYGLFSWQLFSHKLCRWLVPFAAIIAGLANAVLIFHSPLYLSTFILQFAFYAMAVGGIWTTALSRNSIVRIPSFLFLVNLSILAAWYRYARGERIITWTPSERAALYGGRSLSS